MDWLIEKSLRHKFLALSFREVFFISEVISRPTVLLDDFLCDERVLKVAMRDDMLEILDCLMAFNRDPVRVILVSLIAFSRVLSKLEDVDKTR